MFKIFSLKVANALSKKGFEVKDVEINIYNPKFKVFLFEDTESFRKALSEITKK